MYRLIVFIVLATVSVVALADKPNYLDYESLTSPERQTLGVYLTGEGDAYGWANGELQNRGQSLMFCVPKGLALNGYNYEKIFRDELARNRPKYQQMSNKFGTPSLDLAGLILLRGLELTFPCGR